jgi:hypothetical protein
MNQGSSVGRSDGPDSPRSGGRTPDQHTRRPGDQSLGDAGNGSDNSALERWLSELERLDAVLVAQAQYLDAVEHGESAAPPQPFVGTPGLPTLPNDLTPYARDLVQRNADVTTRAMALSAQLRPRHQRPMHAAAPMRGTRFEHQA